MPSTCRQHIDVISTKSRRSLVHMFVEIPSNRRRTSLEGSPDLFTPFFHFRHFSSFSNIIGLISSDVVMSCVSRFFSRPFRCSVGFRHIMRFVLFQQARLDASERLATFERADVRRAFARTLRSVWTCYVRSFEARLDVTSRRWNAC